MSTHVVPVIRIDAVLPHPNADRLDLIPVGGWQCAVQKGAFKAGDLAVYIEPDFMVPVDRPEFAFLKDPGKFDQTYARIRGKKLRGVMSFGLLIPAPAYVPNETRDNMACPPSIGQNLLDFYNIHRWEPPAVSSASVGKFNAMAYGDLPQLPGMTTKFDLENINNYPGVLDYTQEPVVITEKIHGANARYVWWNDKLYVGSRSTWLKPPEETPDNKRSAWHAALTTPMMEWLRRNEGTILYGEVYGNVQDLKYGLPNDVQFSAFAAFDCVTQQWWGTLTLAENLDQWSVRRVPVLATGTLTREAIETILEQDSQVTSAPDGHMKEGVVITPLRERVDPRVGRVSFKLISNRYWTRKL